MSNYEDLRKAIEQELKHSFTTPSDFKWLADKIEERTHERLSISTLMRLWGYVSGVSPRKVTLDILARFLGYTGYDDFCRINRHIGRRSTRWISACWKHLHLSRRWVVGIVVSLALLVTGYFTWLHFSQPDKCAEITSLEQISPNKKYFIHSRGKRRGSLGICKQSLGNSWEMALSNHADTAGTFAILKQKDAYYLYSVDDNRFINIGGLETDAPHCGPGSAIKITARDSCFVFDFISKGSYLCTLNLNKNNGVIITDYGTGNNMFDDRNLLMLEEAGDFDPTEALKMMQEPNQEFEAAVKSIKAEGTYTIYTEKGGRRYYLRSDGCLTDKMTDSCQFVFHPRERYEFYRAPAFQVCYHAKSTDACTSAFASPFKNGENIRKAGRLRTINLDVPHTYWCYQVFYLGKNGCYAVRCTATPAEYQGAGNYWTVTDVDLDGKPEVEYSPERNYIWKIKKLA